MDPRTILQRHAASPILTAAPYPGVCTVFNPAPFIRDGQVNLLVSITRNRREPGSFRETRLATSPDGIRFTMADRPLIDQRVLPEPFRSLGGPIDCRLTRIGDDFYLLFPQGTWEIDFSHCCTVMYRTRDFQTIELVDIVALPFNRGSSLFPEKIEDCYYRLDRPGEGDQRGCIWISSSPDLIHWGRHRPLLAPGYAPWNTQKIGPTPPLRVREGWLVITHGVDTPDNSLHYYIGAMLLDANDPARVLGKTHSYLLAPEAPYERSGAVNNVVFPCGALAFEDRDELHLYYGAADTAIALATGRLSAVVKACLENA